MFDFIEDEDLRNKTVEAHDNLITGLKNKNSEVILTNKTLKENIALLSARVDEFDGLDPAEIKKVFKKMKDDHLDTLKTDGKFDELMEARVNEVEKTYKLQLEAAQETAIKANAEVDRMTANNQQLQLGTLVTELANKAGVLPAAIPDVIRRASDVFKHKDDGFVALNANGEAIPSKDGSGTGLTMGSWITNLREDSPYFFGKQHGGGQKRGEGGDGNTSFSKMNEKDQRQALADNPSLRNNLPVHP